MTQFSKPTDGAAARVESLNLSDAAVLSPEGNRGLVLVCYPTLSQPE